VLIVYFTLLMLIVVYVMTHCLVLAVLMYSDFYYLFRRVCQIAESDF
jgi:hypothetical protein